MLLSSIFFWLFMGISLVSCYALSETYDYQFAVAVRTVFGTTVLLSIISGVPLAILLRRYSPRIVLGKVKKLYQPGADIYQSFRNICGRAGMSDVQLKISKIDLPISFAVDSQRPTVVISKGLLSLLSKDEIEGVIAHELAHIKNSDTALKAMVTAYKTALPHDPVIRLVEAAFHRERELAADEAAVKVTRKPLSLASALLKICDAFPRKNLGSFGTLSILGGGTGLMSRHPPIRQRINQLIRLAEIYK